jgi:mortality factor 4-like protein 1
LADGAYYFVHYQGWKTTWDEWVPQDRVLPLTPENLERQKNLVENVQNTKQKPNPIQKIVDTNHKRRRDSLVEKEGAYLKKTEVKISIPEGLKSQLVQDWESVTKNQKV